MCPPPPIRVFEEFCPFFVILQAFHTRVLSTGVLLTVCFIGYWMELARFARVVRQLHGPCLGILPHTGPLHGVCHWPVCEVGFCAWVMSARIVCSGILHGWWVPAVCSGLQRTGSHRGLLHSGIPYGRDCMGKALRAWLHSGLIARAMNSGFVCTGNALALRAWLHSGLIARAMHSGFDCTGKALRVCLHGQCTDRMFRDSTVRLLHSGLAKRA